MSAALRRLRTGVIVAVLAALAATAWLRAEAPRAFFSGDEGLKSAQRAAFAAGHAWLDDPAAALVAGPTPSRLTPWRPPFVQACGHRLCSVWRNPVVRLGAVLERWGGPPLAASVAWLGLALWLWATSLLAARLGASPSQAVLALLIASPAWMYGVLFWEHAPAAAAITWSLAWALGSAGGSGAAAGAAPHNKTLAVAGAIALGALFAVAVLSRPEVALLGPVCLWMAMRHRGKAEIAGWVVGGALAATVALSLGDGLSAWLANNAAMAAVDDAPVARRLTQAATLLAGTREAASVALPVGSPVGWPLLSLSLASFAASLWLPRRLARFAGWGLIFAAVWALIPSAGDVNRQLVGLLLVAPAAWFGLAIGLRRHVDDPAVVADDSHAQVDVLPPSSRRLFAGLLTSTLVLAVIVAPNDGGSQWGPRYLLPWLAPALVLALSAPVSWRRLLRAALVIGFVAQLAGVRHLQHQQADKSAALRWLTASPAHVLVAQAWYTPQELAALSLDRGWTLALAADLPALQLSIARLRARHVAWWIFAADPRLDAHRLLGRGGAWRVIGSRDVAFPPTRVRLHLIAATAPQGRP